MKLPAFFSILTLGLLLAGASPAIAGTYTVNPGGGGDFTRIQDCIDAATSGDVCEAVPGTYNENIDFLGKNITVRSTGGAGVTIIDGLPGLSVVSFQGGETADARLTGFTITGGLAIGGGGIYCSASSPTINGCTITGNQVSENGAGVYCCLGSSPTLNWCTISGNETLSVTGDGGGGIYCSASSPTINHCAITNNSTQGFFGGGGIYCDASSPVVTHSTFRRNESRFGDGAGIYCAAASAPVLTNCLIHRNAWEANEGRGAGIYCSASDPVVTNCTIVENIAAGGGGGIFCYDSSPVISNTIVCQNESDNLSYSQVYVETGDPAITYSAVRYGTGQPWFGTGCIDQDPVFAAGNPYYLSQTAAGQAVQSPCVDAGDPATPAWGWREMTTRTDGFPDRAPVDMGFHYATDYEPNPAFLPSVYLLLLLP